MLSRTMFIIRIIVVWVLINVIVLISLILTLNDKNPIGIAMMGLCFFASIVGFVMHTIDSFKYETYYEYVKSYKERKTKDLEYKQKLKEYDE